MPVERAQEVRDRVRTALSAFGPLRDTPADFEPADTIPWEEQAEQLLRCRLAEGFIGLRPPPEVDRDVERLIEHLQLPEGASVLVLGCGPGMYSNRLAAHGFRVTGVDIAAPVLAHAEQEAAARGLPCDYRRLSVLELDFDGDFDAAVLTNSIINHLDDAELGVLLGGVQRSLVRGGQFACEVMLRPEDLEEGEGRTVYDLPRSPWCDEPHIWLERRLTFPEQGQRVAHHIIVPEHGEAREYWSRFDLFGQSGFEAQLHAQGLLLPRWFADGFAGELTPRCERAWVLTTAAPLDAPGLADLAASSPGRARALVRSSAYWRAVLQDCPVAISDGAPALAPPADEDRTALDHAQAQLADQGYFALHAQVAPQLCDRITRAVLTLSRRGWDAALVALTDEAWQLAYGLAGRLRHVAGQALDFRGELFAFCVDPSLPGGRKRGVPPHRDRPDAGYFDRDGRRQTRHCTCWVSLTDATVANGCMHLVPLDRDPALDDPDAHAEAVDLGMALETNPGSVLGWAGQVLHWGGTFDEQAAAGPRVAMGFALTHNDLAGPTAMTAQTASTRPFAQRLEGTVDLIRALHPPAPGSAMGVALDLIQQPAPSREGRPPRSAPPPRPWNEADLDAAIERGVDELTHALNDADAGTQAFAAAHLARVRQARPLARALAAGLDRDVIRTLEACDCDTETAAWSLLAAAGAGTPVPREPLVSALRHLLHAQAPCGGFASRAGGDPCLSATAAAVLALATFAPPELPATAAAATYLGGSLGGDNLWRCAAWPGFAAVTYHAVRALKKAGVDFPGLAPEIATAIYRERIDGGGWGETPQDAVEHVRCTASAVLSVLELEQVRATGTYANDSNTGAAPSGRGLGPDLAQAVGALLQRHADATEPWSAAPSTLALAVLALDGVRTRLAEA